MNNRGQQQGPIPGANNQGIDPNLLPHRYVEDLERVRFTGRELVTGQVTETHAEGAGFQTRRHKIYIALDCCCSISSAAAARQCEITSCQAIVCERHAASCSLCSRQVCTSCGTVAQLTHGWAFVCNCCWHTVMPDRLTLAIHRILRALGF